MTVWLYTVELSDSLHLTVYYEYSTDPTTAGYILFDSTKTITTSTSGASETQYVVDTILADNVNASHYRIRVVGGASNDKASGVTIQAKGVARRCPGD